METRLDGAIDKAEKLSRDAGIDRMERNRADSKEVEDVSTNQPFVMAAEPGFAYGAEAFEAHMEKQGMEKKADDADRKTMPNKGKQR